MKLFVFGSLKKGEWANAKLAGCMFLGKAVSHDSFLMADVGYPMIVPVDDDGGHRVEGEIYEINAAVLAACDRYEGYPSHYTREEKLFSLDPGDGDPMPATVEAWVYFNHNLPAQAMRVLPADDGLLRWFKSTGVTLHATK